MVILNPELIKSNNVWKEKNINNIQFLISQSKDEIFPLCAVPGVCLFFIYDDGFILFMMIYYYIFAKE